MTCCCFVVQLSKCRLESFEVKGGLGFVLPTPSIYLEEPRGSCSVHELEKVRYALIVHHNDENE
jgi:hypothetical protein